MTGFYSRGGKNERKFARIVSEGIGLHGERSYCYYVRIFSDAAIMRWISAHVGVNNFGEEPATRVHRVYTLSQMEVVRAKD